MSAGERRSGPPAQRIRRVLRLRQRARYAGSMLLQVQVRHIPSIEATLQP